MSSRPIAALTLLATMACGNESTPPPLPQTPPPEPGAMPTLERRPLAIAEEDRPERSYWPMAVRQDGRVVYLASPDVEPIWRVADSTGLLLKSFGRPGDGPGEFRGANQITLQGDTLLFDEATRQIRYDWSGHYLGETPTQVFDIPLAWHGDSVDRWILPRRDLKQEQRSLSVRRSHISGTGGRDLIPESDSVFVTVARAPPIDGRIFVLPYALGPDRIYVANANDYQIHSYSPSGELLESFGRDLPPHRRGPRELEETRQRFLARPKSTRGPTGEVVRIPSMEGRLDTLGLERTPHFWRSPLHVDQFGRLWVVGVTNDSTAVDLFDAGVFLGRIMLPCYLLRYGHPVALTWPWLVLECQLPEESDYESELQLYRIVEGKAKV